VLLPNLKGITMKMIKTRLVLALAAITLSPAAWSATTATGGTGTTTGVCSQTGTPGLDNGNLACGQTATASGANAPTMQMTGGAIAIGPALANSPAGSTTTASGGFSVVVGANASAVGAGSVSIGAGTAASGTNSVSLGYGAFDGGQSNVVSVGNTYVQRKIINVANGTLAFGSTDAATAGQLFASTSQLAYALGGGASATATGLMPPAYTINGATYTDVGSALQALANMPQQAGLCQYSPQGGIICGRNTTAAASAVAQGDGASAGYAGSLAIGAGATILAPSNPNGQTTGAIAIGQGAQANADPAVALGNNAQATGANSVAVGDTATASGAWSAALGASSTASGPSSTALGSYAQAAGALGTAVGSNASASGTWSTAVGYAATATGTNSVAIGTGSVANRANSVSVGSATQQRQITNVAPGTMGTDAVNVNQLNAATAGIVNQANQHADQVAAMAAATSMTPQFGPKGYALTAAVAGVGSQSAVGVGFARAFQFHDHPAYWQASVGFNGGSGTAAVKVGGSIGW
jgi:autotransporter adhesin